MTVAVAVVIDLSPNARYRVATADALRHAAKGLGIDVDVRELPTDAPTLTDDVRRADDTGEVRAVERTDHPLFLATLYQPQLRSTAAEPHPVWLGFLEACR